MAVHYDAKLDHYLDSVIAIIAAGFLGTLAGKRLLNRLDDRMFRRALDVILVLLSLRLIWGGIRQLLAGS